MTDDTAISPASLDQALRLDGHTALVTGAGASDGVQGTGTTMAALFAARGARVAIVDISRERAERTLGIVEELGGEGRVYVGDVSEPDRCDDLVGAVVADFGRLDHLVNNAAISSNDPLGTIDRETWDRTIAVNLTGPMFLSRAAVPHLQATSGTIVNVSSVAAIRGISGQAAYTASKGGLVALTRQLAFQLGPLGIRVNSVAPGHIHSSMSAGVGDDLRELRRLSGCLQIEGTAWDVAWAALFLASPAARWISGVVLPVDAGAHATMPLYMFERMRDGQRGRSGG